MVRDWLCHPVAWLSWRDGANGGTIVGLGVHSVAGMIRGGYKVRSVREPGSGWLLASEDARFNVLRSGNYLQTRRGLFVQIYPLSFPSLHVKTPVVLSFRFLCLGPIPVQGSLMVGNVQLILVTLYGI